MLLNNVDAHRCSYFELGLPVIYSATKIEISSVGFSRNVSCSLIVKPKIELSRNYNMSGGLIGLPVLKVACGNN